MHCYIYLSFPSSVSELNKQVHDTILQEIMKQPDNTADADNVKCNVHIDILF